MPTELDVVALYRDGWNSQGEKDGIETHLVRNLPQSVGLVLDYVDVADLVQQTSGLLQMDPDHPCLRSLEIIAHGNPGLIDNLTTQGAVNWGRQLMTLNWCDQSSIYLSACNTGLQRPPRWPAARRGPVAKSLADAMPYDPNNFDVKLTVYGSNGYFSGSHALNDESTVASFSVTTWHAGLQWPPIWKEVEVHAAYQGGRNATGSQVWIGFKNGNW